MLDSSGVTNLVGLGAGAIASISFAPQIWRTLKTRRADDVSMSMLLLTLGSVALYEIYAMRLGLWPVVIMNGMLMIMVCLELGLKLFFARK